jgi:periplasmic divalent cation tolerance protein
VESETLLVLTTCGSDAAAQALARRLVEQKLAACVNAIGNVASTYRWQGEVHEDRETLLIIKTTQARLPALTAAIRAESTYDLPEVIALRADGGSSAYLAWVAESVAAAKD